MLKHPTQAHQLQTELKPRPRIQEFSALGMAFRSNVGVSAGGGVEGWRASARGSGERGAGLKWCRGTAVEGLRGEGSRRDEDGRV